MNNQETTRGMKTTKTGARLRPMLFSTEMVQAILEGRKTQTRRVVKSQPRNCTEERFYNEEQPTYLCPYGQAGDVIWVRETWSHTSQLNLNPEDDNYGFVYKADGQDWEDFDGWNWKPSIHMPFAAARIFLRVKSVRVERLQDISERDAIAEGIERNPIANGDGETVYKSYITGVYTCYPYVSFRTLWQSINGPESWVANPWVWVVEFERITKEEAGV